MRANFKTDQGGFAEECWMKDQKMWRGRHGREDEVSKVEMITTYNSKRWTRIVQKNYAMKRSAGLGGRGEEREFRLRWSRWSVMNRSPPPKHYIQFLFVPCHLITQLLNIQPPWFSLREYINIQATLCNVQAVAKGKAEIHKMKTLASSWRQV